MLKIVEELYLNSICFKVDIQNPLIIIEIIIQKENTELLLTVNNNPNEIIEIKILNVKIYESKDTDKIFNKLHYLINAN